MQLSNRLYHMAQLVQPNARVVDVGTDHGFIPIYLILNQKASFCIASDINQGPLDNAKKHITRYNVSHIELRKSNGLDQITLEDQIETIIIGGMGGPLINTILKNDLEIVKGTTQLILQPQNHVEDVRKTLHQIGFRIIDEIFLEEDGKYYTILHGVPGIEKYEHDYDYVYGKLLLEHPNATFKKWMLYKKETYENLLTQLETIDSPAAQLRRTTLLEEYHLHKEACQCIF